MGAPNPLWTGEPARSQTEHQLARTPSDRELAVYRFALRSNQGVRRILLAGANRVIDALRLGDSILVTVAPQAYA